MKKETKKKRLLKTEEVAEILGYEQSKLYEGLYKDPDFPAFKLGDSARAQWRVYEQDLYEWIDRHSSQYKAA